MTDRVDAVVVGAGAVGLAVARALVVAGLDVLVLERESAIGTATSSRNSGVIHAGIYYTPGSHKALLCVRGRELLYRYCEAHAVPARRCGKIIVATEASERPILAKYAQTAAKNGVRDLAFLEAGAVAELEPEVRCVAALHSPASGIVDIHAYLMALWADIEQGGGMVVRNSRAERVTRDRAGYSVDVGGDPPTTLLCDFLVNCAGHDAQSLARGIEGLPVEHIPGNWYARGHYFSLSGPSPFRRLVYPVADAGGLGIHVTLDLAGRARFGPDVTWAQELDYRFDESLRDRFVTAIRRYWPGIEASRLNPDFVGVRPKISAPGSRAADFMIEGPAHHGVSNLVNLFGIESPGLTSSLAIGEHVAALLLGPSATLA